MADTMRILAVVAAAAGLACGGDVRDAYVGRWRGFQTLSLAVEDGPGVGQHVSLQDTAEERIQLAAALDRVQLRLCTITARIESETELRLDPRTCPMRQVGGCNVTETILEGTGVLSGDVLTITYTADTTVSGCSVQGSASGKATIYLSKQH